MRLEVVRQLERVKRLHANRAEEEQRRRRAAFEAAVAAVETARTALESWRAEMPARQAAIYDAIIGQVVGLEALEDCKARVMELRAHEVLLDSRLAEAGKAAQAALAALQAADSEVARTRRDVTKFEDLVQMLRRLALAEAERREDAELEEAAEAGHRGNGEGEDEDWDQAA